MSITTKDFNLVQQEANEILVKLESLDSLEWAKKKDLIESFISKNRILLDNDKLPLTNKKDFCSFIQSTLSERNITINRNGNFYRLFNDDEKGNQHNIDQKSINISSGHTAAEEFANRKEIKILKENDYTRYFDLEEKAIKNALALNNAIKEEYQKTSIKLESGEVIDTDMYWETLEKELDLSVLTPKMIEANSVLELAREHIDDRNKYGMYEKTLLQFLISVGETKADAARIVGYCSKYASIGIERDPEVLAYRKWLSNCPLCHENIGYLLDEEYKNYQAGEPNIVDNPIKGY